MNILITGGCGFIGSNLAVALRADGHEVTCFDNLLRRGSEILLHRVRDHGAGYIHGDIRQSEDLQRLSGVYDVINGAGEVQKVRREAQIPPRGPCAEALLSHCFISIIALMVRGKLWMEAENLRATTSPNTDYEYFMHLLRRHPVGFGFLPNVLGSYRRWPQSMSRGKWKWNPEDVDALERIYRTRAWEGLLLKPTMRRILLRVYQINADYHRQQGWAGRAVYLAGKGIAHAPRSMRLYGTLMMAAAQGLAGRGGRT